VERDLGLLAFYPLPIPLPPLIYSPDMNFCNLWLGYVLQYVFTVLSRKLPKFSMQCLMVDDDIKKILQSEYAVL
jgi:hypothetical protein